MKTTSTLKIFSFFLLLCLMLSCIVSCGALSREYRDFSFDYFDTLTVITGYEINKISFDKSSEKIKNALSEYHKLYDIYNFYDGLTNLAVVNRDGGLGVPIPVDEKIIDLLELSVEMYSKTNGAVNIAMGSVLSLWHECRAIGEDDVVNASLPDPEALSAASLHTDITKLVIDRNNSTVHFSDPEMKLDVGAIAKGYAVERVARELEADGVGGYLLNVGGNVRAVGSKPNGEKWVTAIQNPNLNDTENPFAAFVSIENESVVTSGTYQRYYIVEGKSYHHIIDRNTLMPADFGYDSVSVISSDSGLSDAISTALFCMTVEEGRALIADYPQIAVMWIMQSGEKIYSDNFSVYQSG